MMTPRLGSCCAAALTVLLAGAAGAQTAPPRASVKVDSATISGLGARNIGSAAMSGRIAALAAVHEGARLTIYVGAASGGVWKSVNGGNSLDRKSTRLNSSHLGISYAVFCLKKKKAYIFSCATPAPTTA